MPEKQALGMTMQISQEYINNLATEMIRENLLAALGGSDKFVEELTKEILNTKVDRDNGRVSSYSSRSDIPYIQYLINKTIREEVTGTLQEMLDEKRPEIREKIRKELMKKNTVNKFFDAFTNTISESLENKWLTKFEINFEEVKHDNY